MGVDYAMPAVKGLSFGLGLLNPALGVATTVAGPMAALGIDRTLDLFNARTNEEMWDTLEDNFDLNTAARTMGMINAPGAQAFAMPGTYAVPVNITKSKFGVPTIQFPSTQAMFGLTPQEIVNQIQNRQNAYSQGISPAYQDAVSRMAHTYGIDYTRSVWGGDDDRAKTALAMDVMSNPGFYSYDTREKAYEQAFGGIGSELAGMGYNQQEEDAFDAGYEAAMGSSGGFGGGSEGVDGGFSGGFSGGIEEAAVEGGDTGLGQASSSSSTGGGSEGGSDSDSEGGSDSDSDDGCFILRLLA